MGKAIFWDFDGTLTVSAHLWSRSVLRAAGEFGEANGLSLGDIHPHLTTGFAWHDWQTCLLTGDAWWRPLTDKFVRLYVTLGMSEAAAVMAAREVRGIILDPASYEVYADAEAALAACADKGWHNYLLSNNYPELEAVLGALGLLGYFDGCVVSGVVGYNKPRREIFELALEMAGRPEAAWMVGDNPVADVAGGRAAGMRTILVHRQSDCGADHCLASLAEIADVI